MTSACNNNQKREDYLEQSAVLTMQTLSIYFSENPRHNLRPILLHPTANRNDIYIKTHNEIYFKYTLLIKNRIQYMMTFIALKLFISATQSLDSGKGRRQRGASWCSCTTLGFGIINTRTYVHTYIHIHTHTHTCPIVF
jgi:hypothetical protein